MRRLLPLLLIALAGCRAEPVGPDYQAANAALMQRDSRRVLAMLKDDPSAEAERLKATALLQLQDLPGAARHLDLAVAAGGSAAVYADYAQLELIRGHLDQAGQWQQRAERADGSALMPLQIGGEIALARGQADAALAYFDRALDRHPDNLAALAGRAHALARLQRWGELAPLLDRLDRDMPGDTELALLRRAMPSAR
ncbi:MAG: hypothetical protein JSR96_12960 [Proteobacteria bacterium]|nr:hypothetical protein [Pseudomonadota bacterium]